MNRKFLTLFLALLLAGSLSSCGGKKTVKDERTPEQLMAEEAARMEEALQMGPPQPEPDAKLSKAEAPPEQVKPAEPPPPPKKTPLEILAEAKAYYAAGKRDEALEKALEARKELPESAEALELAARLYYELGMDAEALPALETLVAKGQGSNEALLTFVELSAKSGGYEKAALLLEKRVSAASDPEATGALGWLWYKAGENQKALAAFTAIEKSPVYPRYAAVAGALKLASGDLPGARDAAGKAAGGGEAAALVLADTEKAEGHASAAEESYRAILKRSPTDYGAKVNLGVLKLGQGENKTAAQLFEEALKARPELPEASNNLGLARRALGDHAGAEKAYEVALAAAPDYPPALKNLGILLEKYQGRPEEAVGYYERYLKKVPGDKDVERYLKSAQRSSQEAARAREAAKQAAGDGGTPAAPEGGEEKR